MHEVSGTPLKGLAFEVPCPYCQHTNRFRLKPEAANSLAASGRVAITELIACDVEEGGCDKNFVFEASAAATFTVKTFALAGVGDSDTRAAEDLRLWTVKTRHADDPEADSTSYLDAADVKRRAPSHNLYALALEMGDGDSLKFVSVSGLVSFDISCQAPEAPSAFDSFRAARHAAREAALRTGVAHTVGFTPGDGFRVYGDRDIPIPPPPSTFEEVLRVEPPVVFRIQTTRVGIHSTVDAPEGYFFAEVFCDDSRANPDLQSHGNSEIFRSAARPRPEDAARDAAEWIRGEFPTLDAEIQSPFDVEEDEIPL
jgi:hypothetical protein